MHCVHHNSNYQRSQTDSESGKTGYGTFPGKRDGAVGDSSDKGVYLAGLIPLLIGVALLIYSTLLAPKE